MDTDLKRNPEILSTLESRAKASKKGHEGDFIKALWAYYDHRQKNSGTHGSIYFQTNIELYTTLITTYTALCGHSPSEITTPEDFFHPSLTKALTELLGEEETTRLRHECEILMEFPYARGYYRPSYRSHNAGDYNSPYGIPLFLYAILRTVDFTTYGLPLEEMLSNNRVFGLDDRAALALRQGNQKIRAIIEEAILGDNSNVTLNRTIIAAIVKSGDSQAIDLLGKLLLAAKGQEGIRQAILETCDQGTLDSHIHFIKLILENDLCRFAAVIRAFDTWSGLSYGDQNQRTVEKCIALALKYLTGEVSIETAVNSPDTTEIYLALWAQACRDIHSATTHALGLLSAAEKYKRVVGWYFITYTANENFRHNLAVEHLHLRDLEELAWATSNLSATRIYASGRTAKDREKDAKSKTYPHKLYPKTAPERATLFAKLAEAAEFIGNKSREIKESVFPWHTQKLDAAAPCWAMLGLAAYDRCKELTEKLAEYLPLMDSYQRQAYYTLLLNPEVPAQRALLLEGLSDKGQYTRKDVLTRLSFYPLAEADITRLIKTLTSQSANLRTGIMSVLRQQDEALITPAIDNLLESRNKNQLIAGVELLDVFSAANPSLADKYASKTAALKEMESLPQDIIILLDKLGRQEDKTEINQSLYNPNSPDFNIKAREALRPDVPLVKDKTLNKALKKLIIPDEKAVIALYERLTDVIIRNRDYEYEITQWNGTKDKVLLGGVHFIHPMNNSATSRAEPSQITDFPLPEEWLKAAGDFAKDKIALMKVLSLTTTSATRRYANSVRIIDDWYIQLFDGYPVANNKNGTYAKILDMITEKRKSMGASVSPLNTGTLKRILEAILNTKDTTVKAQCHSHSPDTVADPSAQTRKDAALFDFAFTAYVNLVRKIPHDQLGREYENEVDSDGRVMVIPQNSNRSYGVLHADYLSYWRGQCNRYAKTEAQQTALFNELWYQFVASGMHENISMHNARVFRAHSLGLISEDALYHHFTNAPSAPDNIRSVTKPDQSTTELLEKYPQAKDVLIKVVDTIVTTEENRGELPTPTTNLAANIHRFQGGVKHFVNLLAALGTTGFHRGYTYYYHSRNVAISKTESLSKLLRCCHPTVACTPEGLRTALKAAKITEKRVIQAAIYAPIWAGLLEKAMDISGLKSGVWFFHAHVSENFSVEKETEVAIFAAISTQEFKDGIFDKNWFFEAYNTLGDKRWGELYKNAKYITDSNSAHRRSQLYTDAVLGRLNKDEIRAEIIEKRNQEKLRAYALIPLDGSKDDALTRYEFIQRFKKESREFGAARQASEGRAAEISLDNLAITAGYDNTDRMVWALEGAKIDQLRPLMSPQAIGGVEVWLNISEDGTPELSITKNGKPQKTVPKALAKNETVLDIKNAVKELKGQKSRARYSLETAMISRATFTASEISGLLAHPILGGMVRALVIKEGDNMGFPALDAASCLTLTPPGRQTLCCDGGMAITIAHPHDFMASNTWSQFQQHIYQNKIVQPFKQVFREYYPLTQDEKDAVNLSRRYAGHQVQPKKTVSLLKTRGWTADYEEGLQRVWHKENIIVRMYALADWFSPADIEAPTLETIQFFSRDKGEPLPFTDIPPVIFSETMRDIDMVVSVAHAGGVDPEASHSTVEMRIAIAREFLALLRVENVSFKTAHAIITGNLGEYSIHMGSAVMHKLGAGMLAVLPVHSQARGKIFLPFADEDPKTAEIMAKILLFADDTKIKDPSILAQIRA